MIGLPVVTCVSLSPLQDSSGILGSQGTVGQQGIVGLPGQRVEHRFPGLPGDAVSKTHTGAPSLHSEWPKHPDPNPPNFSTGQIQSVFQDCCSNRPSLHSVFIPSLG